MNTEILKNAFIPESEWDNCYISDDGMVFTPRYDDKGIMLKTGEQAYSEYMEALENPPISEPTEQEQINAMLMREIAILKGQVTAQWCLKQSVNIIERACLRRRTLIILF